MNDTNMSLFIRTFLLLTSLIQYGGIGSYVNIDLKSVNESSLKNLIVFLYFFKSIFNTHISSILLYNVLYNVSLCFLFAKKYNRLGCFTYLFPNPNKFTCDFSYSFPLGCNPNFNILSFLFLVVT